MQAVKDTELSKPSKSNDKELSIIDYYGLLNFSNETDSFYYLKNVNTYIKNLELKNNVTKYLIIGEKLEENEYKHPINLSISSNYLICNHITINSISIKLLSDNRIYIFIRMNDKFDYIIILKNNKIITFKICDNESCLLEYNKNIKIPFIDFINNYILWCLVDLNIDKFELYYFFRLIELLKNIKGFDTIYDDIKNYYYFDNLKLDNLDNFNPVIYDEIKLYDFISINKKDINFNIFRFNHFLDYQIIGRHILLYILITLLITIL